MNLLLLLSLASAGDTLQPPKLPANEIRLPVAGRVVAPTAPTKLTPELVYVVDSDVPVLVVASPEGIVKITKEPGPLRIRGKFADGDGKFETRTYSGKFIYSVEPVANGKCELLVIPTIDDESKIIRRALLAEIEARPPPDPQPQPNPNAGKLAHWVLVEESAQAAFNRGATLTAAIQWSKANGIKHAVVDQNTVDPVTKQTPADLVTYLNAAKKAGIPQIYFVDKDGNPLWSGSPPADLLAKLKEYGP